MLFHRRITAFAVVGMIVFTGCGAGGAPTPEEATTPEGVRSGTPTTDTALPTGSDLGTPPEPEHLTVVVTASYPHDSTAFTQGLAFNAGRLFESRGLYADQETVVLTELDPTDGTVAIAEQPRSAGNSAFSEGITVVGDRIIQITWQSETAYVYNVDTLVEETTFTYEGEGWGICDQPDRLVMSDGSSTLTFRDRNDFSVLGTVDVADVDGPVDQLNELECVDGNVWANVWNTDRIVVIDPDTGFVIGDVDASVLADPDGRFIDDPQNGAVLNGIAYSPDTERWLITGKQWPEMFDVAFTCETECELGVVTE